ncbi:MAG: hypothetical protein CL431_10715 [Acidimicrobiaceae bacterium]|nr:hypothetical protein [Acidimicrobiaceae bacterium]|tara:strand:+ start:2647 stop:3054 length:408 start_codon:yes stop_codon:yes gene_type:complete
MDKQKKELTFMSKTAKKKTETTSATTTTEQVTTATTTEPQTTTAEEVIEVEWEEVQHIHEFRNKIVDLENYFSNMCLTYEKNKANIMTQIVYGQNDLYNMAQSLQKSKNIDEGLTYELKLPTSTGEKGYFLRKDD